MNSKLDFLKQNLENLFMTTILLKQAYILKSTYIIKCNLIQLFAMYYIGGKMNISNSNFAETKVVSMKKCLDRAVFKFVKLTVN